jgi:mutator protein MutT
MATLTVTAQGTRYVVNNSPEAFCSNCGNRGVPVLVPEAGSARDYALCEPCTRLVSWAWNQISGDVTGPAPPWSISEPSVSTVLIVRENRGNPGSPYDLLAVERKDQKGSWSCPGGKIEAGETAEQAAVRELKEETGLITWPGALETLYFGYSMRGRLVQLFLCRGYYGMPLSTESTVDWKAWPPEKSLNYAPGFYRGVSGAFQRRLQVQQKSGSTQQMSLRLSRPGYECCMLRKDLQERALKVGSRQLTEAEAHQRDSDREMVKCFILSMSTDEITILKLATGPIDSDGVKARTVVAVETAAVGMSRLSPSLAKGAAPALAAVSEDDAEVADDENAAPDDD